MSRLLSSFPLRPTVLQSLLQSGCRSVSDLHSYSVSELRDLLSASVDEVRAILRIVNSDVEKRPSCSALDLLKKQASLGKITTGSRRVDDLLDGGVAVGSVTEFCGVPGIGKTNAALQLCVNVQLPKNKSGAEGEALYIDTEGSFSCKRIEDIAANVGVTNSLEKIQYMRVHDFIQQVAAVAMLPQFLTENPSTKLVVLDSVAFHFRPRDLDYGQRARLLQTLGQQLAAAASDHEVAIVLTNQVTTRFDGPSGAYMAPALGESWGHACTHRLMLRWSDENERTAMVYKSPALRSGEAKFAIGPNGINDVELPKRVRSENDTEGPERKRQHT